MTLCDSADPDYLFWSIERNNPNVNIALRSLTYPQSHFKFNDGAGSGVLQRKALSQCHILLCQQDAQRHGEISQGAFVLVIFHLWVQTEGAPSVQSVVLPNAGDLMKYECYQGRFVQHYLYLQLLPPGVVNKE